MYKGIANYRDRDKYIIAVSCEEENCPDFYLCSQRGGYQSGGYVLIKHA